MVRTYVARLRRELHEPGAGSSDSLIRTVGGGYVLAVSPEAFDLAVFRRKVAAAEEARRVRDLPRAAARLREALALWRGEALAGVPGAHAESERSRLEILRLNTLTMWLDTQLELGAHTAVIPEVTGLVDRHPLDERFRELLMLALYRAGQQARALASYRDVQVLLADELGVDPGPGLQSLYERILRADPGLLAPSPDATNSESPAGVRTRAQALEVSSAEACDLSPADDPDPGPKPSEAPGGVREQLAARAGLPPRLAVFSGRAAELEAANALLHDPENYPGAIVVSGMAGVGKTTFAVHWAHQLAARFPDGQFYLNLRGFDPSGVLVTASEAVRAVLGFLGAEPGATPDDAEAASALYRSLLSQRRILLVLDNVRLAAQVRPLLPGASGSVAIITSRNRLAGLQVIDGAQCVTLGVPTAAEARDLLARRIGAQRVAGEPEAVREITERCGRLPLALAIAAAHCAAHPTFPLSTVTAAMSADTDTARLDVLSVREADEGADARNVFSWSYHALSPEAARLFRLLALHPGPDASTSSLASLAGLPRRSTEGLLAELTGAHLLTEHAPGRYECHDLLRAYAGELNQALDTASERAEAGRRLLDHYLHSTIAAFGEYRSSPTPGYETPARRPGAVVDTPVGRDAARRWFETEYAVLMRLIHQALVDHCDEHVWHLAWAVNLYLYRSGHRQDSIALNRWALRAAERLGRPIYQAVSHNALGFAYCECKRTREALHHHTAALGIFEEQGDVPEQARSHLHLAVVARGEGRSEDCIAHNERGGDMYRRLGAGYEFGLAVALANLAWQYGILGEHDRAVELCRQSLDLWIELDEPHAQAQCHDTLGYSTFHRGQHDQAFEHFQRAIDAFRELGDGINQAVSLTRLGDAHAALGDRDAARAAWSQALALLRELNHSDADELEAKLRQSDLLDADSTLQGLESAIVGDQ